METVALFEQVGFIYKYREKMETFYRPYFQNEDDMTKFFVRVFENEDVSKKTRRMMNQIERLVSLANDIEQIRPGRDPLRIMFLKICMESLAAILGNNNKTFAKRFVKLFSEEATEYILDNFRLSYFKDECDGCEYEIEHDLTLEDFFEVIKFTRDTVVHDGNYWGLQFFSRDAEYESHTEIETDVKILKSYDYTRHTKLQTEYRFVTTLDYGKFVTYFVEACIRLVQQCAEESGTIYRE